MRRYDFLEDKEVFEAFNKVRDAFLAAKDGKEVDKIMEGLLTRDEKLKIGRRIIIATALISGATIEEVVTRLRVGRNTAIHISRRLEKYQECFDLIDKRSKIVEKKYQDNKFKKVGGSQLVFKKKVYTGVKRKDIKR